MHPKILIVCTYFGRFGAAYRRLDYFIKYLRSKQLKVCCASSVHITSLGLVKPSRECYGIPFVVSTRNYATNLLVNTILSFVMTLVILILRPKVVIVSIPDSYLVTANYLGCVLTRSRLIIDVRDPQEEIMVYIYRKGFSHLIARLLRRINYSIYRRAYAVIGVTRTLITMLAREIRKPIHYVPNGADLEVFKPISREEARKKLGFNQDSLLIAFVGHLFSYGYYNVLPVLATIRRSRKKLGINIKLVVAGSIYDEGVKRTIESFKDVLEYVGVLDTEKLVTLMSACDIGIIPRVGDLIYNYAIPVKFYEYVATGLPSIVIAYKESELAKVVEENKLGFVCEPEDQACLENSILTLANNRSILNELKRNVLVFRRYIDRRIGAERLYRLIKELLQE